MMRSFFIAFVTTVAVAAAGPRGGAAAQPKPAPIPVAVANGTPGVNIEFYLNAGKLADAPVSVTGDANWLLDLSNMGKTKVTLYVDVCKDGKIVKVMFVSGSGQAPPEDEGCRRRLAAVSFQSDCGVTKITLNFANFGAQVIGCGGLSFRDPKVIGGIGGGAVLIGLLAGGGGDSTTTNTFTSTPLPTTTTPPPVASPPVTVVPPVPSANTTPVTTTPPRVTANGRYRCVAVNVVADNGRHNPTINLGPQIAGDFTVMEGSITIRHPAPFIDIVGAFFDTASGRFNGDARGTVAGFPNVGVRAEGTVDTATGRIQFNYTMGTGGELPGGQPITYAITLQRQ